MTDGADAVGHWRDLLPVAAASSMNVYPLLHHASVRAAKTYLLIRFQLRSTICTDPLEFN